MVGLSNLIFFSGNFLCHTKTTFSDIQTLLFHKTFVQILSYIINIMDRRQQEYNQMEREREENEMLTQNLLYLNAERTVVRQQVSSYQSSTPSRNVVKKVMVRTNNSTNITPSRSFLTPQAQSFVRTTTSVASPAVFSQNPPRITSTATLSTAPRGSITKQ